MNRWSTDAELVEFILNESLARQEQEKHGNTGYTSWTINGGENE